MKTNILKSTLIAILLIGCTFGNVQAQEVFPVFSYGDETVNSDEFLRVFNKNRRSEEPISKAEIEEYLELYTKFKLKVAEAYDRKMDTIPSFIKELDGYRRQLAQPYLTDKSVNDRLLKEAYDRGLEEVNASHLLIKVAGDARPTDTLIAYNQIMGYRTRVLEKGEDFGALALQFSDDPSAKQNKGDLGYFTAFQMIYPFENAAYTTPLNKVSMPIRTQFGYHLVFVKDRRKAMGQIKAAHIMVKFNNESEVDSAKRIIDAVYTKLENGGDWNTLVEEFSQDFSTNSKGGQLSWFNRTSSNIPTEFKDEAYNLKEDGAYSAPIKTKFGWHVIKRLEVKPVATFKELEGSLKRKIERDSRSELNKEVVLKRIKVENEYVEVKGVNAVINAFDENLLQGRFEKPETTNGDVLFTIDRKSYTDKDFFGYVATNQGRSNKTLENAVLDMYDDYVKQSNLDYEESILEKKYADFKNIMQEYKDGILLFELTDKEVWSKAVNDSLGLAEYYEANKASYMWDERADATIFSCKDEKTASKAQKCLKKGESVASVLTSLNDKDALAISADSKKFEKGSNDLLDKIEWAKGVYPLDKENDRIKFVSINEILSPSQKPLEENLGQATSDYQNFLEAAWIEELKLKYPLKIMDDNIPKLYQN